MLDINRQKLEVTDNTVATNTAITDINGVRWEFITLGYLRLFNWK